MFSVITETPICRIRTVNHTRTEYRSVTTDCETLEAAREILSRAERGRILELGLFTDRYGTHHVRIVEIKTTASKRRAARTL